jgi:hypothetical protein
MRKKIRHSAFWGEIPQFQVRSFDCTTWSFLTDIEEYKNIQEEYVQYDSYLFGLIQIQKVNTSKWGKSEAN